jgi:hypothetical protein
MELRVISRRKAKVFVCKKEKVHVVDLYVRGFIVSLKYSNRYFKDRYTHRLRFYGLEMKRYVTKQSKLTRASRLLKHGSQ